MAKLQNDCSNHDPRYSTLVAEHEMRQRVKTHWNEQRHFMVPDHGSLPWLARICSRWLLGSPSVGSALHESIFLTVLHHFTHLRLLVIGFEEPKTCEIVGKVNQDFSIGLAKYLAGCGGERLQLLRMQGVWPVDLEILLSTLRDTQAAAATQAPLLPKETEPSHSCPGAWPAVAPHPTSPASIFQTSLALTDPRYRLLDRRRCFPDLDDLTPYNTSLVHTQVSTHSVSTPLAPSTTPRLIPLWSASELRLSATSKTSRSRVSPSIQLLWQVCWRRAETTRCESISSVSPWLKGRGRGLSS
ncbi:MAG: hypothetical protein L6R36_001520 [Xanthoria steineri]|nr:MAG: hypothetical protein L6R36_001520 [Xanthoria steineri]